jgi:phosphoserine aminotransferase
MSSSIGTKAIDISKYAVVFGSVSCNLGPEGLTVVIVREDLIGKHHPNTPSMFNWKLTYDTKSIFNTTPCFAVYMTGLCVDYLNRNGGVSAFA